MTVFVLPDLGEGLQEAEIVAWHVVAGDHVLADQPLVSVETDKALVEVPSPVSGTVVRVMVAEREVVPVGAPLAEIDRGQGRDVGAIVGDLPTGSATREGAKPLPTGEQIKVAPAVRHRARERGIDLAKITGSGPGGAILTRDLETGPSRSSAGVPLQGPRRAMARAMERARGTVVPATLTDRAVLRNWPEAEDPTVRLVRAIVAAVAAEPALNVWFDGTARVLHDHVDLGIAVDTAEGLFTPVLRDAGRVGDLGERIARLRDAVHDRSISPQDLRGATLTLSNFGTLGGRFAAMVVTPPQVAILGAGRIVEDCVAENGQPIVRRVLPLSLTVDHRVVTGGEAARFLAAARASLERRSLEQETP